MKRYAIWILLLGFIVHGYAQSDPILLRINNEAVTLSEFERALNKHYQSAIYNKKQINEYLNQFIDNKLKIAEAKRLKLNDDPKVQAKLKHTYRGVNNVISTKILNDHLDDKSVYPQEERWKIMQIFKRIPQNSSNIEQERTNQFMQSLYAKLINDPQRDFAVYVDQYSEDKRCIGVGLLETTPEFEQVVSSLQKGEISKPFMTPQGVHIIKVLDKQPSQPYDILRRIAKRKDHINNTEFIERLKVEYNYKPNENGINHLLTSGQTDDLLFTLNGNEYTGRDFRLFAEENPKGIHKQLNEYKIKSLLDCKTRELKNKYPELSGSEPGNEDDILLAEINFREIQNKARNDRAGLIAYFSVHKKRYRWDQPRFRGVIVHTRDKKIISTAKKLVKGKPVELWGDLIKQTYNIGSVTQVEVEQGLFAEGDNTFVDKLAFKKGQITPLQSFPFTALIGKKVKGPDHYEEVFDRVVPDYEKFLDRRWISALREAYHVEINEEVLKTVNNH